MDSRKSEAYTSEFLEADSSYLLIVMNADDMNIFVEKLLSLLKRQSFIFLENFLEILIQRFQ